MEQTDFQYKGLRVNLEQVVGLMALKLFRQPAVFRSVMIHQLVQAPMQGLSGLAGRHLKGVMALHGYLLAPQDQVALLPAE